MAINKNHEFDELDGIKCSIVEKNVTEERVIFLKEILTINNYNVVVVASPNTKKAPLVSLENDIELASDSLAETTPATFTVGVTDYTFNTINAIFGRLLKDKNGHIVTFSFWQQKEKVLNENIPYFEN